MYFHRTSLQRLGVWDVDFMSVLKSHQSDNAEVPALEAEASLNAVDSSDLEAGIVSTEPETPSKVSRVIGFYENLLSGHGAQPKDYYIYIFALEFLAFFTIIFGWNGFRKQEEEGVSSAVTSDISQNNIPSGLLGYMLMQFLLMVLDRIVYLLRSEKYKLILHYALVVLIHILIFYVIPKTTERSFTNNPVLITLYLLKVAYFWVSSLQIRAGYPQSSNRNFFMKDHSTISYYSYTIYKAIPFLDELRQLLDWTCTTTTLELFDWFKLEDVYGQLFVVKHNIITKAEAGRKPGEKQPLKTKWLTGAVLVALLIGVIWMPLLVMSVVNRQAVPNVPVDVAFSLQVNSYEKLFQIDSGFSLPELSTTDYKHLVDLDSTSSFVSEFSSKDIQRALLSPESMSVWQISPPSRASLQQKLDVGEDITLTVEWSFQRPDRPGVALIATGKETIALPPNSSVVTELRSALVNDTVVHLPNLFPSVFSLDAGEQVTQTRLPRVFRLSMANCTLHRQVDTFGKEWWTLEQSSPHVVRQPTVSMPLTSIQLPSSDRLPPVVGNISRTHWLEIITFNSKVRLEFCCPRLTSSSR